MSIDLYFYIGLGIFFFIGVSIAGGASANFLDAVKKRGSTVCSINLTAPDFICRIIAKKRLKIHVVRTSGKLTDFYSSKNKVIAISSDFWESKTLAALSIAAHEAGHAITDAENNATFIFHQMLAKFCRFLNRIFYLVLVSAFVCLVAVENVLYFQVFFYIAISTIALSFILNIITVRNEKNASKIGIKLLKEFGATGKEIRAAEKIYSAALTTYIGAIFMPIVRILRFIVNILYNTIGRAFR